MRVALSGEWREKAGELRTIPTACGEESLSYDGFRVDDE